jgi:hypothetical protein
MLLRLTGDKLKKCTGERRNKNYIMKPNPRTYLSFLDWKHRLPFECILQGLAQKGICALWHGQCLAFNDVRQSRAADHRGLPLRQQQAHQYGEAPSPNKRTVPPLVIEALSLVGRLLPGPDGVEGNRLKRGGKASP